MSPEKEAELQSLCPIFLRDLNGDPMKTCMAWGLAIGDGWYEPIKKAFLQIEELNKKSKDEKVIADQVKEKFGELRVYYSTEGYLNREVSDLEKEVRKIIHELENTCAETCEICGAHVEKSNTRWAVLCPECDKKRQGWDKMPGKGPSDSDSQ